MAIFGTAPGTGSRVYTIPGASTPAVINVPGLTRSSTLAITSVGFGQDANVQFMQSLRKMIYVYSFGERMGTVEISGVAFYRLCDPVVIGQTGIKAILNYYKDNSVSRRSDPLTVTLGQEKISGFLRSIRSTFQDPARGVIGFTLILSTMPEMW